MIAFRPQRFAAACTALMRPAHQLAARHLLDRWNPVIPTRYVRLVSGISVLALIGSALGAAQPVVAADPLSCFGYLEPRVFLEAQAWWLPPHTTGFGQHIHLGTCFPYKQRLAGIVGLDVRILLHEMPIPVRRLRAGTQDVILVDRSITLVPDAAGNAIGWFHLDLDTAKATHDGRTEIRISAWANRPDGTRQLESTGWQVYLANGKPVADYRSSDVTIARGWYTGYGYENASLESDLPSGPLSGIWSPAIKLAPGSGGLPVTNAMVTIDPDFHAGNAGRIVIAAHGPIRSRIAIDTVSLANGPHVLALVTSADTAAGTLSGVLKVPFSVRN